MFLPVWTKIECKVLQKFQYILCALPFFTGEKNNRCTLYIFHWELLKKKLPHKKKAVNAK